MADDGKPTEPTEADGESRRTKRPTSFRDVTSEVGGYTFVGGFPPEVVERLKARVRDRDNHERAEPEGDE